MNFSSWIPIFLLVFILYYMARTARRSAGARHAAKLRRRKGAEPVMEEIIQKLMGEDVYVTTINDTLNGKLTHYADGWITLTDKKGREEYVNADYIIRMNKSGK